MKEQTPGPWIARARHRHNDGTQDELDGVGWDIEGPPIPWLRGQFARAADARLIAAAPDMRKALEGVMRMTFEDLSGEESGEIIEAAVRALAKARGEDWPPARDIRGR